MSNTTFSVFYSWQSDTPAKVGRNFIEDAAKKALKKVHAAGVLEEAPRFDKDTKNMPGMPDIANTILDKIRVSSAFLVDLTFINTCTRTNTEAKVVPNPNVLLELGYAVAHLGWERIICVMNTCYGEAEDLPFNLRHRRWPISFQLADNSDATIFQNKKNELVSSLYESISSIAQLGPRQCEDEIEDRVGSIENLVSILSGQLARLPDISNAIDRIEQVIVKTENDRNSPENRAEEALKCLIDRVNGNDFEKIDSAKSMLGLVVLPCIPIEQPLQLSEKKDEIKSRLKPLYYNTLSDFSHGKSFVTYSKWDDRIDAVSEITELGIISAAGHETISVDRNYLSNNNVSDDILIIPSVAFERNIIDAVKDYVRLLSVFGIPGPWIIKMSLFNLKNSVLYVGPGLSFNGRTFNGDVIRPNPVTVSEDIDIEKSQSIAQVLRPIFDSIWREHNFPQSLNYTADGMWGAR